MTLPDLPRAGSRELVEFRAAQVLLDAELWRDVPDAFNVEKLVDSVDRWRRASEAYHVVTLAVLAEMEKEMDR